MKVYRLCLSGTLIVILVALALYFHTLLGVYQLKWGKWAEDAFIGQELRTLKAALQAQGVTLEATERSTLVERTNRSLRPNEHVYRFLKGREYRAWFLVGSVQNVGYVVTETTPNGERIVEIFRLRYVDAP